MAASDSHAGSFPFKPGQVIRGHQASYRIIAEHGQGGRGKTYTALVVELHPPDPNPFPPVHLGMIVIIKTVNLDLRRSSTEILDFLALVSRTLDTEIMVLHRLQEQGLKRVAKLFDAGRSPQHLPNGLFVQVPFIVQEKVEGDRLDEYLLRRYGSPDGTFSGIPNASDWLNLVRELVDGLVEVHQQEVVHRDIWHKNIFVQAANGRIKVVYIDFGEAHFRQTIAHDRDDRKDSYVAPERREMWLWPSRRADIWAMGAVLFYLATGEEWPRPIHDDDALKNFVVEAIKRRNSSLLMENAGIVDIIARCLRYDPTNRIRDADYLLQEIHSFFSFDGVYLLPQVLSEVANQGARLAHGGDELMSLIAAQELLKISRQMDSMLKGIRDLNGDHEELVSGLARYLSVLGYGDEYLAVSIPSFWSPHNMGVNGRFLTMNRLLAERGVRIRRVFLVTEEDMRLGSLFHVVASAHLTVIRELPSHALIDTRYLIVSGEKRDEFIRKGEHKGVWIKGKSAMLIIPVYDRNLVVTTVRMRRYEGEAAFLRGKLSRFIEEGIPLQNAPFAAE